MIKLTFRMSIRIYWKDEWRRLVKKAKAPAGGCFAEAARHAIEQMSPTRSKSTLDNYSTALRSLLAYAGADIASHRVDSRLLEGWQQWLHERGVTLNTVSCYMRSMRVIAAAAGGTGLTKGSFDAVYTGNSRTDKRSLPAQELLRLCQLPLSDGSPLSVARDIFLFSVYALGMPFVDVAFLQKRQVHDGYIVYHRHKTRQTVRVKIEPPMLRIMRRYQQAASPYVFPLLSAGTWEEYETVRGRYNRQLRLLGRQAGLGRRLTSYVARHSWASLAYHSNVELPVISKALGHTSSKTTLTYISEIDDHRIDTANRRLLHGLIKKGR